METRGENVEGMPVGYANFRELRDLDLYFIDKSPLIEMILKNPSKVKLFTRPRRFGKSLNMSMLDAYLNIEYASERDRFSDLKISELRPNDPEKNSNYVIKLNFKRLETSDFNAFLDSFRDLMVDAYESFPELDGSDKITNASRKRYAAITSGESNLETLYKSIMHLCTMIESHFGKKPIILIDEYDQPMNGTYKNGEIHEKVVRFLGSVLGHALKDNDSLRFAVLTGVMRMSKESIFSGVNNIDIYDVFSQKYGDMFGFTPGEVEKLLADNGHPEKMAEAQEWYDGYVFGDQEIYNPWSILKYVNLDFTAASHWAGTSGNSIIEDLISRIDSTTWNNLKTLCSGGSVMASIRPEISYSDLHDPGAIFSVMVASGYLKALPQGPGYMVSLPNKEMFTVLAESILNRYGDSVNVDVFNLIEAMARGNTDMMAEILVHLMEILSNRILTHEHVYQGFLAGLMAIVHGRYEVSAEREVRDGYYDVRLKRLSGSGPNIVAELKRRNEGNAGMTMEALAQEGLRQIHENDYLYGLEGETMLYGIAFSGKDPTIAMEKYTHS